MTTFIFDLDGCVIDSSHRYESLPNGEINLAKWIENQTEELIALDKVLPLAPYMRKYYSNHRVVVCTSRVMSSFDYLYLIEHDMPFHEMLSRPEGCTLPCHMLKEIQLRLYADRRGMSWERFCRTSIMYEDTTVIIDHLSEIGLTVYDARIYNALHA